MLPFPRLSQPHRRRNEKGYRRRIWRRQKKENAVMEVRVSFCVVTFMDRPHEGSAILFERCAMEQARYGYLAV
jgi:hypothetical protein